MQAKRLTQEDFAMNHPAGRIGKRLILKVHDVMLTGSSLPLIGPDVLIMEVSTSLALLQLANFSCCCLVGVIEGHSEAGTWDLHEPCCDAVQALGELSGKALGCLLVVGTDGKLLGTFTDGDLRRTLQSRGAQVTCSLAPYT